VPTLATGAIFSRQARQARPAQGAGVSDFLNPYQRMIPIRILGRSTEVPENNTLLRCFQFLCPETVPYGKFCWNNECGNSKFYYKKPDDSREFKARACCFTKITSGLEITMLSAELKYVLRDFFARTAEQQPEDTPQLAEEEFPELRFKSD